MARINVKLDLSTMELEDLVSSVKGDLALLAKFAKAHLTTPAEAEVYRRQECSLEVVLEQLESAQAAGHDGGPVGSARYGCA